MAGVVCCVWDKLACGVQKLYTVPTKNIPSCSVMVWRTSARQRRASGARRSRNVAFSRLQPMEGSLPPPLLQNRACHFGGIRLLSDAPSATVLRLAVADSLDDL